MTWSWSGTAWMRCEEHGAPYPKGAECPKCAANPIAVFLKARERYEEAQDKMVRSFDEWRHLVYEKRFNEAKESLRPMPECSSKVIIFGRILSAEQRWKEENENR